MSVAACSSTWAESRVSCRNTSHGAPHMSSWSQSLPWITRTRPWWVRASGIVPGRVTPSTWRGAGDHAFIGLHGVCKVGTEWNSGVTKSTCRRMWTWVISLHRRGRRWTLNALFPHSLHLDLEAIRGIAPQDWGTATLIPWSVGPTTVLGTLHINTLTPIVSETARVPSGSQTSRRRSSWWDYPSGILFPACQSQSAKVMLILMRVIRWWVTLGAFRSWVGC